MKLRILCAALLLSSISFCGARPAAEAPPPQPALASRRLVLVDGPRTLFGQNGFDWATLWLIRDDQTGKEFLIARTPESIAITQIREVDGAAR